VCLMIVSRVLLEDLEEPLYREPFAFFLTSLGNLVEIGLGIILLPVSQTHKECLSLS